VCFDQSVAAQVSTPSADRVLAGRVALQSDQGARWEFGPGDSFVVPSGFAGTWEVLEDCRKLYAIYETAA
jgi:hypothetical protein